MTSPAGDQSCSGKKKFCESQRGVQRISTLLLLTSLFSVLIHILKFCSLCFYIVISISLKPYGHMLCNDWYFYTGKYRTHRFIWAFGVYWRLGPVMVISAEAAAAAAQSSVLKTIQKQLHSVCSTIRLANVRSLGSCWAGLWLISF